MFLDYYFFVLRVYNLFYTTRGLRTFWHTVHCTTDGLAKMSQKIIQIPIGCYRRRGGG